jgi:hypothetical protein
MDKTINCGKSNNTMAQTDLLEDLVGMPGLGGDDDEMIEVGSDYPYHADLQSSKKTISKSKHNIYANGWKDVNHNSN